jgi:hypothetical protein
MDCEQGCIWWEDGSSAGPRGGKLGSKINVLNGNKHLRAQQIFNYSAK